MYKYVRDVGCTLVGLRSCEGVSGDLGVEKRCSVEECGLADVGFSDDRDGQQGKITK